MVSLVLVLLVSIYVCTYRLLCMCLFLIEKNIMAGQPKDDRAERLLHGKRHPLDLQVSV